MEGERETEKEYRERDLDTLKWVVREDWGALVNKSRSKPVTRDTAQKESGETRGLGRQGVGETRGLGRQEKKVTLKWGKALTVLISFSRLQSERLPGAWAPWALYQPEYSSRDTISGADMLKLGHRLSSNPCSDSLLTFLGRRADRRSEWTMSVKVQVDLLSKM